MTKPHDPHSSHDPIRAATCEHERRIRIGEMEGQGIAGGKPQSVYSTIELCDRCGAIVIYGRASKGDRSATLDVVFAFSRWSHAMLAATDVIRRGKMGRLITDRIRDSGVLMHSSFADYECIGDPPQICEMWNLDALAKIAAGATEAERDDLVMRRLAAIELLYRIEDELEAFGGFAEAEGE